MNRISPQNPLKKEFPPHTHTESSPSFWLFFSLASRVISKCIIPFFLAYTKFKQFIFSLVVQLFSLDMNSSTIHLCMYGERGYFLRVTHNVCLSRVSKVYSYLLPPPPADTHLSLLFLFSLPPPHLHTSIGIEIFLNYIPKVRIRAQSFHYFPFFLLFPSSLFVCVSSPPSLSTSCCYEHMTMSHGEESNCRIPKPPKDLCVGVLYVCFVYYYYYYYSSRSFIFGV